MGKAHAPARQQLLHGGSPLLICPRVVHGRLQILRVLQLHVDTDVVGQAADEEIGALAARDVRRMARQCLEAVSEVLHRAREGEAAELGQAAAADRRPEPAEAQVTEALP